MYNIYLELYSTHKLVISVPDDGQARERYLCAMAIARQDINQLAPLRSRQEFESAMAEKLKGLDEAP